MQEEPRTTDAAVGTRASLCAGFLLGLLIVSGASAAPVKLAERTPVRVMLLEALRSGSSKVNDSVNFEVREDIYGPGRQLLVAKGTPATGTITKSERRKMFGKPGKLEFTCSYTTAVDGSRVQFRGTEASKGKSNTDVMAAAVVFVNVLGILVQGRDAEVPKGTEFTVFVDKEMMIDPDAGCAVAGPVSETPPVQQPAASRSLSNIVLTDGSKITCVVKAFANDIYTVEVAGSDIQIRADKIQSIEKPAPVDSKPDVTISKVADAPPPPAPAAVPPAK